MTPQINHEARINHENVADAADVRGVALGLRLVAHKPQ
jgi:hypothetical protein